ncbi:MAG: hypothetical protein Q9216_003116 [Gyalolechia sp. 2 TL-2023]
MRSDRKESLIESLGAMVYMKKAVPALLPDKLLGGRSCVHQAFIGSGPLDDLSSNRLASTDEGAISFDSPFAPKSVQPKSDDPWTSHELPQSGNQHATCALDHHRGGRLQRAIRYNDLPRGRSAGKATWDARKSFGSRMQPRSGLTSLFERQPQPPTVVVAGEDNLLGLPSVEQECPLSTDPSSFGNYCHFGNALDPMDISFASDPPPSVLSTDDEDFLEEASASSQYMKESSVDVPDDLDAFQTPFQPSEVDFNWRLPTHRGYDRRYLSPVDLRARPEAVPTAPSNNYKPGVAHSYPPARTTTDRHIAPRSNITTSEYSTPPKRVSSEANVLAIVREDGKGGALLPPSTPKKGRRITG